ncbi:hypothetical protein PV08_07000 [Exophiala spinifera]|uniref:Uncharacterized protein n=1 Tax=Exophiala spinifera TaxID=91928 RepID=A0A0D2B5K7_9EURO|nr:uncharacterized protein PV08_07000 [Exophiala spinifera]KIW14218.1 hypothetical protein PV08_07000 [Exophiala spinifera]
MFRFKNAISGISVNHTSRPDPSFDEQLSDESADQVPPLASTALSTLQDAMILPSTPAWLREEDDRASTRHSRASSIVSTRTKYSINSTQEDARSINIDVGGQRFRISRDGSTITNDEPPPYAPPGDTIRFRNAESNQEGDIVLRQDISGLEPDVGTITPRSSFVALNLEPSMRANIIDPSEFSMPSPVESGKRSQRSSSVSLVENSDPDTSSHEREPPRDTGDALQSRTTFRQAGLPPIGSSIMPSRNRRRGLFNRLPSLDTSGNNRRINTTGTERQGRSLTKPSDGPLQVRSAGAILSTALDHHSQPQSPDYIGRDASASFPLPRIQAMQTVDGGGYELQSQEMPRMGMRYSYHRSDDATPSHTPLPMDTENDISLHYAKMMRKLDYTHRKALHLRDQEMAELRERLHEKDTVLRQQLRAKDFLIEDLRKRLSNLEENIEGMLERARNEVEDLWESRWKDRDFHLRERMRRIEEDAQMTIDKLRVDHSSNEGNSDGSLTPS